MRTPVIELNLPAFKLRWVAACCALAGLVGAAFLLRSFIELPEVHAAASTAVTPTVVITREVPNSDAGRSPVAARFTPMAAPTHVAKPLVPTVQSTTGAPVPAEDGRGILDPFCRRIPFPDWIYAVDHLPLVTDISESVRAQLEISYRPSCNYDPGNLPQAVVIHFTRGDTLEGAVAALRTPGGPSAHYVIDRDGTVVQMLPEALAAAHVSCDTRLTDCLALRSIGIELVNRGQVSPEYFTGPIFEDYQMSFGWRWWEDYPEAQVIALRLVIEDLIRRWGIPLDSAHILGHYRINQKADPGPALNLFWNRFGSPARPAIFDVDL